MSVLTKVFVVLLTVFSIALSMLVVAAFARQEDWRRMALDNETAKVAADAKARVASSNAQLEQQRSMDRHRRDMETINGLRDKLAGNEAKIATLDLRAAESENKLAIEQGQASALGNQNNILLASLNSEKELAAKLSRRNAELERRSIDLNDRVKELTVNVAMATSQIRALRQQIAEGGGADLIARAGDGTPIIEAHMPTAHMPAVPAVVAPIRGQIRDIRGGLASISVGNTDGVAPGMIFLIYRRGEAGASPQYLGSLRITRVDANESAGQVEQSTGDIRPGDSVRDELSFARR